jgi:hypothetical protein
MGIIKIVGIVAGGAVVVGTIGAAIGAGISKVFD